MTLKLCGFAASNYYNKVKLQLLEKDVAFEEELVYTGSTHPKLMARSPMGKVPFIDTPGGAISESTACAGDEPDFLIAHGMFLFSWVEVRVGAAYASSNPMPNCCVGAIKMLA